MSDVIVKLNKCKSKFTAFNQCLDSGYVLEAITAAISEIKQLRADVARMPVTRDGKRVMRGDYVFSTRGDDCYIGSVNGKDAYFDLLNKQSFILNVGSCYSTSDAALEAAKKGEK